MSASVVYQLLHVWLEGIRTCCDTISQYTRNQRNENDVRVPRVWMYPHGNTALNGWSGDPFAITEMAQAFDRSTPAAAYEQGILVPGDSKLNTVMAHKLEMDYLSMMERSFRLRHMSPVRAIALTAGRRIAHGDPQGIHSTVRNYIQDRLAGN